MSPDLIEALMARPLTVRDDPLTQVADALVATSRERRLDREMSHDGTQPVAQAAAARRELAANIQAAAPMVRDAALGFVPVVGSAMDAEDAANAWRERVIISARRFQGLALLAAPSGMASG